MDGRRLCRAQGALPPRQQHAHPADPCASALQPRRRTVVFTSDVSGYGNVYMVDLPDFATLPDLED
ncbi:MAG: hypothetical protein R2854_07910 [Caldilineaceae bacterium]